VDTSKIYQELGGSNCTIWQTIQREPAAEARIKELELIVSGKTFCDERRETAEQCIAICQRYFGDNACTGDYAAQHIAEAIRSEVGLQDNCSEDQYLLTHILYPVLFKLCQRYDESCEKHGPWTSATLDMKMVDALKEERREVDIAWIENRIEGPHGEIDELYDEANCCVKRIFALTHGAGE